MSSVRFGRITKVTQRILQVVAILCMCLVWSLLIHKGFKDLSVLIEENPNHVWHTLGRYFITNLAGGYQDSLMTELIKEKMY